MKLILSFLVVLLCSCKVNTMPEGILAPDKMQDVLWDMVRADEFLVSYVIKDTSVDRKAESIKLYEKVFYVHDISKSTFEKSFKYYQQNPEILKPIMDSLTARKTSSDIGNPVPILDSLQKPVTVE